MNIPKRILNSYYLTLIFVTLMVVNILGQTYTFTLGGAGITGVNGVYIYKQEVASKHAYIHVSGAYSVYYSSGNSCWVIDSDYSAGNELYWFNAASADFPTTTPYIGDWMVNLGTEPAPTTSIQNTIANMTFTDGSSFVSSCVPNTANNAIGRFKLQGSSSGGVVQAITVTLNGTWSGASNVKLWSSTSGTFSAGSSTQCGSTIASTSPSTITVSSFNSLVDNSSGTYYFITVDLASGATGNITPRIPSQASFTFIGANQPGAFTNAQLSGGSALPVELIEFSASSVDGKSAILSWTTATEVNNYGFEIERKNSEWEKIGFVPGNGNSNSPKQYSFTDEKPLTTTAQYRLKQIDNDGACKYYSPVDVEAIKTDFTLLQNYPNPFNPSTVIKYSLPFDGSVKLVVYNTLGKTVRELVNESMQAGYHETVFNAAELSSGMYYYSITANSADGKEKFSSVKKMILLR